MTAPVRRAGHDDIGVVVALHGERIAEGFLVTLGPRFVARLYRRIARSERAELLVAEVDGRVVGFVAVTTATGRLYREFLLHDAALAGLAAAPSILRSPRRVWETLRYGTRDDGLPPAEILSVAVASDVVGHGIGGSLVSAALAELVRRDVHAAHVVTAVGNQAAIAMYERAGFVRHGRTEVHPGAVQEVLVWP